MKLFVFVFLLMPMLSWANNIRLLVPFSPGGSTDIIARILAESASEKSNLRISVINRVGAGGSIATKEVAKAQPDGNTLVMSTMSTFGTNHAFMIDPGFHPINDFEHVILLASAPRMLAVRTDFAANNVHQLIGTLKKNPKKFIFGTSGRAAGELFVASFTQLTNTQVTFVPFKGGSQALADLLGGHIHIISDNLPLIVPYLIDKRVKMLAISWPTRLSEYLEVPTWAELGYLELNDGSWQGIAAPAGTPKEIVEKLNATFNELIKVGSVRQRMIQSGFFPVGGSTLAAKNQVQNTYNRMVDAGLKNNIIKE